MTPVKTSVDAERQALQETIARRAACTDISSFGRLLPGGWIDIADIEGDDQDEAADIKESVRYLELSGLLEFAPPGRTVVKIR